MFVTKGKLCNNYEMAKLINKKRKNYAFPKKKSLVGSTPELVQSSLIGFSRLKIEYSESETTEVNFRFNELYGTIR